MNVNDQLGRQKCPRCGQTGTLRLATFTTPRDWDLLRTPFSVQRTGGVPTVQCATPGCAFSRITTLTPGR